MEYITLGFFFLFLSSLEILKNSRIYSYLVLFFCSCIMVLFVGTRDGAIVGTDSPTYFYNYQYPTEFIAEFGYKYIAIFFSKVLNANYNIFLLFINGVSIFLISQSLKRNSVFLVFPLLIYFSDFYLYYNFSGIRQALAVSFSSYAIYYGLKREYKTFFLIMAFAIFFHISSIVFFLAIFVPKKILSFKNYFSMVLPLVVGLFLVSYVIENNEYLNYRFKYYSEIQENSVNIVSQYIVGALKRTIVLVLIFFFRKQLLNDVRFVYFFNLYLLGVIIYMSTYLLSPDFGVRFSTYYTMLDMFLIGNMLYLCEKRSQKTVIFLSVACMVMYKIFTYAQLDTYLYKFAL